MTSAATQPVMVTTLHRGVFFGYITPGAVTSGEIIRIYRARACLYWSADCRGFLGLAAGGPTDSCKIGPQAPAIELRGVTAVVDCTETAAIAWERAPWA